MSATPENIGIRETLAEAQLLFPAHDAMRNLGGVATMIAASARRSDLTILGLICIIGELFDARATDCRIIKIQRVQSTLKILGQALYDAKKDGNQNQIDKVRIEQVMRAYCELREYINARPLEYGWILSFRAKILVHDGTYANVTLMQAIELGALKNNCIHALSQGIHDFAKAVQDASENRAETLPA